MMRSMKVEAMVTKAINDGYELLGNGIGSYDEALKSNRDKGYDVRCWYTLITKEGRQWIMYGKKKVKTLRGLKEKLEQLQLRQLMKSELSLNLIMLSLSERCARVHSSKDMLR